MKINRYMVTITLNNGIQHSLLFRHFDLDDAILDIEDTKTGSYYIFKSDLFEVKTVSAIKKKEIDSVIKEQVEVNG